MEIVVFGAGSLGSVLGGLLSRANEVTLVGRPEHMRAVERDGLAITGTVNARVHPAARTEVDGLSADLALVTVKAYDTAVAARSLAKGSFSAVCSIQNGLGNEEVLAEALACPVLGGTSTYGGYLEGPGRVRMTGSGTITIGRFRDGDEGVVSDVVDAFEAAGLEATRTDDIRATLWDKLVVNAAINPLTALARTPNGGVSESPLREIAMAVATEVVEVAQKNDVALDQDEARAAVVDVAEATAENRSSMRQDIEAGRPTEIDAINGIVVDRAGSIDVPINETLAGLVRAWEREQRLRD